MYKWTVIYLINCTDEQAQMTALEDMFAQIFKYRIPAEVAVVICMNITVKYMPSIDPKYKIRQGVNPISSTTVFYKVSALKNPNGNVYNELVSIADENPQFNYTKENVQTYFEDIVIKKGYSGESNMLLTWGHGASFGLFLGSGLPDGDEKFDMLSIDDLKDAILASFGNNKQQKINLVVMMNCFMQFFDTCFALRQSNVDFLVASASGAYFSGYNYAVIFSTLFNNPNIQPEALAILATNSIDHSMQDATFFTSNLSFCEKMADSMGRLGEALRKELPKQLVKIKRARDACDDINVLYNILDFFRLTLSIRQQFGDNWQKTLIDEIMTLRNQMLLATYIGSNLQRQQIPIYPLGYLTCFPPQGGRTMKFYKTFIDPQSPLASGFSKSNQWAIFTAAFVNSVP